MKIVVTGPDGSQANGVGQRLSDLLGLQCRMVDSDVSWKAVSDLDWCVVIVQESLMLDPDSRRRLRDGSIIVLLYNSKTSIANEVLRPFADIILDSNCDSAEELVEEASGLLGEELAIRFQSANTFGEIIRVTTFGESHGAAIGAVLDGIRPGIEISAQDIQGEMDRRRPGQSLVTTQRKESDEIHILSGVFEGKTTGAPIAMVIYSQDQDSSKYEALRDMFRPGHADFTYYRKYGVRDYRGGGRSSGRETAGRVACGAIARKMLSECGVRVVAHAVEIAGIRADSCDLDILEFNSVRCADTYAAKLMEEAILKAKDDSDSVGGIVQLEILGVPVGLGDPVFFKLDARLAHAIMTLGAVKGIEIGRGFELAKTRGSESNDCMADGEFLSNNAGGILGGISTGQPIILRAVIKPTSSIAQRQKTIDIHWDNHEVEIQGRHDPCIVPRIIPVIENMAALVILDAWEIQSRLRPDWLESK
jgi:chorismate synthase